jgi:hypothetical protein
MIEPVIKLIKVMAFVIAMLLIVGLLDLICNPLKYMHH